MEHDNEDIRDLEKNPAEVGVGSSPYEKRPSYVYEDGAVPGEAFEYGTSLYAKAQRLAGKIKIEQRGIERVPEDERTDHSLLNVGSMVRSPGFSYFKDFFAILSGKGFMGSELKVVALMMGY